MSGGTPVSISGKADTVLTTKGDIVGYDTVRKRIGVGTNDQALIADSTDGNGIAWKSTAGLGSNIFTGSQTIPPNILKNQGIAGLAGLTFEPTASNAIQNTVLNPSGTVTRSQLTINRQSNPVVNADSLAIGGDIYNTNKFAIRTYSTGTGTIQDLEFIHGSNIRMRMATDGINILGVLNVNGNNIDNIQNLIHDISVSPGTGMNFSLDQLQTLSRNTTTTFNASNIAAGRSKTLKLLNTSGSAITLGFTSSWKFVGAKPTELAGNKTAILTLTCFGSTDSDIVAAYAVEE